MTGHRIRRLAAEKARQHSMLGVQPRCRCWFCSAARAGRPFVPADLVKVPRLMARAVVCCETEAFEQEGAGHDPYCPAMIGGAA